MIHQVCYILDKKAKYAMKVMTFPSIAVAIRTFTDVLEEDNELAKHPEDYTLYSTGTFDDQKCELTSHEPEKICNLAELLITE